MYVTGLKSDANNPKTGRAVWIYDMKINRKTKRLPFGFKY